MKYTLLKDIIYSLEKYDEHCKKESIEDIDFESYKSWLLEEPTQFVSWDGKEKGRSMNSIINTLIVHLNRYAKTYSKSVIQNTEFVSQEDFIYLINLNAFGAMTKMDLIKKNIHEKSPGMQIINRLIAKGWIDQIDDEIDKRQKLISITTEGKKILEENMANIRNATNIVTGDLTDKEKIVLISLLQKLDNYHYPIYTANKKPEELLEYVNKLENSI
ncbi:MarR family winged helix-turn-helix transcriptional regulator [Faecalibacter macacae]|uniref:MarR family transcriptional regulator n=1 Tax=Faecalibacter macacae TaxID=1859289 RepID=A0A3L9MGR5_9FLAO|nr:winged helix DNA-binding protein [Faecalibacter macacae]RLZ12260.1 MarR family transcriptional regulator [Faecalibacter macacae]